MVGKLMPGHFPAVFGPERNEPLDATAVQRGFAGLASGLTDGRPPEAVADGRIALAEDDPEGTALNPYTVTVARGVS